MGHSVVNGSTSKRIYHMERIILWPKALIVLLMFCYRRCMARGSRATTCARVLLSGLFSKACYLSATTVDQRQNFRILDCLRALTATKPFACLDSHLIHTTVHSQAVLAQFAFSTPRKALGAKTTSNPFLLSPVCVNLPVSYCFHDVL